MTDIIGKPLDEIRKLDIDVEDLSDREVCYVVALGMGHLNNDTLTPAKCFNSYYDGSVKSTWPPYILLWQHAGRVLEAMPAGTETATYSCDNTSGAICCYEKRSTDKWNVSRLDKRFKADEATLKKAITKAAAKCVLEGVALGVKDE